MKKVIWTLLAAVMVVAMLFTLVACDNDGGDADVEGSYNDVRDPDTGIGTPTPDVNNEGSDSVSDQDRAYLVRTLDIVDEILDGTITAEDSHDDIAELSMANFDNEELGHLVFSLRKETTEVGSFSRTWRTLSMLGGDLPNIADLEAFLSGVLMYRNQIAEVLEVSPRESWHEGLVEKITQS